MQTLMHIVLSNAILAAVLALVASLFSKYLKNRHVAHLLWLMVLAKLVTPPLWNVPLSLSPDAVDESPRNQATSSALPVAGELFETNYDEPPLSHSKWDDAHLTNDLQTEAIRTIDDTSSPTTSGAQIILISMSRVDWYAVVARLWLVISLLCTLMVVVRIIRFHRLICRAPAADGELLRRVEVLAKRIGLRRAPRVHLLPSIVSPMVWPLAWRRIVLLPQKLVSDLTSEQLDTVIAHELAHLVRRDDLVRFLEASVTCWFWWNPVVWWARRELHAAEEDCCDALVVCLLPESRKQYGEALLRCAEVIAFRRPLPALASGFSQQRFLKRRIEMILSHDFRRSASWRAKLTLLTLALAVLPLAATAVSQDDPRATEEPQRFQNVLPQDPRTDDSQTEPRTDDTDVPASPATKWEGDRLEAWTHFLHTLPRNCVISFTDEDQAQVTFVDCLRCHRTKPLALEDYRNLIEKHRSAAAGGDDEDELEATRRRLRAAEARIESLQKQLESAADRQPSTARQAAVGGERAVSELDLADRYFRAVADLKLARSRLSLMSKDDGVHSALQIDEAKIEMERAEKLVRVLKTYVQSTIEGSQLELSSAQEELNYTEKLAKKGYVAESELAAAKARVARARSHLNQLEVIISEGE